MATTVYPVQSTDVIMAICYTDDMVKVNDWEWLRNRFDEATKG